MKSSDKLLSEASSRAAPSRTAPPIADAVPLQELLEPSTPTLRVLVRPAGCAHERSAKPVP
eukprot:2708978-Prymnesium_polylepis.1